MLELQAWRTCDEKMRWMVAWQTLGIVLLCAACVQHGQLLMRFVVNMRLGACMAQVSLQQGFYPNMLAGHDCSLLAVVMTAEAMEYFHIYIYIQMFDAMVCSL